MTTTGTTVDVPGRAAPAAAAHRVRRVFAHAGNLGVAALAALLLIVSGATIIASLSRHHFEQVITGSMVPVIPVGSMVVTEQVAVTSLHVGDILVFPKPTNSSEVIVHRIVQLTTASNGSIQVQTRGDANAAQDPWVVQQGRNDLADRALYIAPSLGTAIMLARNSLLLLLPALLIVWLIASARRRVLTIVRGED